MLQLSKNVKTDFLGQMFRELLQSKLGHFLGHSVL